jgi:hypothetical protein
MARYKVQVEGVQIGTLTTTWNEAVEVALVFMNDGYKDVHIERVKIPDLSHAV